MDISVPLTSQRKIFKKFPYVFSENDTNMSASFAKTRASNKVPSMRAKCLANPISLFKALFQICEKRLLALSYLSVCMNGLS